MTVNDGTSLLTSAGKATQRSADSAAMESALSEVHFLIFGTAATADVSVDSLHSCLTEARGLLEEEKCAATNQMDSGRLLLDAVLTLSDVLVSAVRGQRVRSKVMKRLEDVVLPILFIRSSLTPQLLRTHALKAPWHAFEALRQKPNREVEKVEFTLASWGTDHGWDFLTQKERCTATTEAAACEPVQKNAPKDPDPSDHAKGDLTNPRTALRDMSWNSAAKRHLGGGIPSYLLTKRRHTEPSSPGECRASFTEPPPVEAAPSYNPHNPIDHIAATTGATVLALKSPVKRRRIDFHAGIPPSPDRPGRCL